MLSQGAEKDDTAWEDRYEKKTVCEPDLRFIERSSRPLRDYRVGRLRRLRMKRIDPSALSSAYRVRRLSQEDIPTIHTLCASNPQYYEAHRVTLNDALIREDMTILPPGKKAEDKYYVGFFDDGGALIAVMDLIDGYPTPDIAYIGFFSVDAASSGRGIGSLIIGELCGYLHHAGFTAIRLAYGKDNPQATRFWRRNRFVPVKETVHEKYGGVIVAQRDL